jgi:uncharacterized cupredoxin-like copper-binding protein
MYAMDRSGTNSRKHLWFYGLISVSIVIAGSVLAWRVLKGDASNPNHGVDGHSHSHAASTPQLANPIASTASITVTREITIDMLDQMRFSPSALQVKQGETIRFVVKNKGAMRHEWVIGDEQALLTHAQEMRQSKTGSHKHDMANAISLAAGEQGVLTWTFSQAGTLAMACFEPGHYEAGMRGVIEVKPA